MRAVFALVTILLPGCFNSIVLTPAHTGGPVKENLVVDSDRWLTKSKIAIIDVEGMIVNAKGNSLFGSNDNPVSLFRERLKVAAADKKVKAVVLRINTPGGGVTASDIMYRDLMQFRANTNKPVVGCMMDVAASGGYYLAMACDHVIAHPTTVTGSIGVIMSLYNASGLMTMLGVHSDPIKSGPNKDIGNPARPMTPEERAIFQHVVNSFYDQFVKVVAAGRKMSEEQVRPLADGRIYTGIDAHRLGLVDQVGYLDDAICVAKELAGLCDARVIAYDKCGGYRGSIYAGMPRIPSEINIKLNVPGLTGKDGTASFLYLWKPGAF